MCDGVGKKKFITLKNPGQLAWFRLPGTGISIPVSCVIFPVLGNFVRIFGWYSRLYGSSCNVRSRCVGYGIESTTCTSLGNISSSGSNVIYSFETSETYQISLRKLRFSPTAPLCNLCPFKVSRFQENMNCARAMF